MTGEEKIRQSDLPSGHRSLFEDWICLNLKLITMTVTMFILMSEKLTSVKHESLFKQVILFFISEI